MTSFLSTRPTGHALAAADTRRGRVLWSGIGCFGLALTVVLGMLCRTSGVVTGADRHLIILIQGLRAPWTNAIAQVIEVALSPKSVIAIVALLVLAVGLKRRSLDAAIAVGVASVGPWVCAYAIKLLVERPRPVGFLLAGVPTPTDASFPSGHVAIAASLAVTVTALVWHTRLRVTSIVGGILFVLIVSISRVLLGAHFPTDTIGSGIAVASGAVLIWGLLPRRMRWALIDTRHNGNILSGDGRSAESGLDRAQLQHARLQHSQKD